MRWTCPRIGADNDCDLRLFRQRLYIVQNISGPLAIANRHRGHRSKNGPPGAGWLLAAVFDRLRGALAFGSRSIGPLLQTESPYGLLMSSFFFGIKRHRGPVRQQEFRLSKRVLPAAGLVRTEGRCSRVRLMLTQHLVS